MSGAEILRQALVQIGLSKELILARMAYEGGKYPDGNIPLTVIASILSEYVSDEQIRKLIEGSAPAWLELFKTGRSSITDDPSALA